MPTFDIPGAAGPIHVVDLREESPQPSGGPPIVFVHGMVGHTGFWNTALSASADRRRTVAIDLRGHGNSRAPSDGDYTIEACAADVLAIMDALALDPVMLVGHSYGACVVTAAAAQRPDRVRRLVLVDPPGDFTRLPDTVRDGELVPFLASLDTDGWRSVVETAFERALAGSTTGTAASVRARLATMPRDAIRGMYRSMMGFQAVSALERYLAAPGASVHAVLAPMNAWPFSLHNLLPAITTTVVPDVGHWVMLDAPDAFVDALEDAVSHA
jgi:pimeloyl-ACP methyl ester carboxylesterase